MKNKSLFLSCIIIINLFLPALAMGNSMMVSVELPEFEIKINNEIIKNDMRKYPFIMHNDITYVPMTYHDGCFLGLSTYWDKYNGLIISIIDDAWLNSPEMRSFIYSPEMQSFNNPHKDLASISLGAVKINGEQIDISNMEDSDYPLLQYREVTYFPLTWHYAVEEFGWQYSFDSTTGLIISSKIPQNS